MTEQHYPVEVNGKPAGARLLRGDRWFAVLADGREVPANDGAHARDILIGRVRVPGGKRARSTAAVLRREPVSSLEKPLKLVIQGPPATKNTGKIVRAGDRMAVIPPAPYRRWLKAALIQAEAERALLGFRGTLIVTVRVDVRFYRDVARKVDRDRVENAIGDFLKVGKPKSPGAAFVNDDDLIRWGDVDIELDRDNPRVEIDIAVAPPTEK